MADLQSHPALHGVRSTRRAAALLAIGLTASVLSVGLVIGLPVLRTQRLIHDLRDRGGIVMTGDFGVGWREWTVSIPSVVEITSADLTSVDVTDGDLAELARGRQLRALTFYGRGVSAEGLRQILRMEALEGLLVIDCPALTPELESRLRTAKPGLELSRRGPAFLGVGGGESLATVASRSVSGVGVNFVGPGSPAQRAGIVPSDLITRFEGTATTDFDELTAAIARRQPGDEVDVDIVRGGARQTLRVRLGGWR